MIVGSGCSLSCPPNSHCDKLAIYLDVGHPRSITIWIPRPVMPVGPCESGKFPRNDQNNFPQMKIATLSSVDVFLQRCAA